MEERGERNLDADPHDIEQMSLLVRQAVEAGAVGFSTSRIQAHRAADGSVVPGSFVAAAEMLALADAVQAGGGGVFEIASDIEFQMPADWSDAAEFAWIAEIGKKAGVTATLALVQNRTEPEKWRSILKSIEGARAQGSSIVAQVAPRPVGLFIGWESSVHIFRNRAAYEEIASLPLASRVERLKDPKVKAAILSQRASKATFEGLPELTFATMFRLETDHGTLDYEPSPEKSIQALAARTGRDPSEIVYEIMMENDGTGYVWDAFVNYTDFNLDHVYDLLCSEASMVSLSDAGAHCGAICDVSMPTFLLTFWTRDRTRGPRFTVEQVVAMQARRTAEVYGFKDRGVIAPGKRADINLIDYEKLRLLPPKLVYDLPASGRRYIQQAEGYRATIVGGVVTFEDGESTGALPGQLLRRVMKLEGV
jgi:N-acyl-D-aspartate/D-glutamate deacylase